MTKMKYPRIYRLLKRQGHSPAKAIEMLIDAKRGDRWAVDWIKAMFKGRRGQ